MKQLNQLTKQTCQDIKFILTDIDDTVTTDGMLTSSSYSALEALSNYGFIIIPVTGRCAGWCDHIARMWPVHAIVGENGAFTYRYDRDEKKMHTTFCQDDKTLISNAEKLKAIGREALSKIEGTKLASDQAFRLTDLAVDFAEDVEPLGLDEAQKIVDLAESYGATAKISSIHVNCWFGNHSKLSTSLTLLKESFNIPEDQIQKRVVFIGDSPNDGTMFEYFDLSIGVANINAFSNTLVEKPTFVTNGYAGDGFTEVANYLLDQTS